MLPRRYAKVARRLRARQLAGADPAGYVLAIVESQVVIPPPDAQLGARCDGCRIKAATAGVALHIHR